MIKKKWSIDWRIVLLWILAAVNTRLSPLDPSREISEYNQESYFTEDGLPQSSVMSITGTPDGYVWLATYEGLVRFDGINFRVFDAFNTPEMPSNRLKVLYADSRDVLWIGSSEGLIAFREGGFRNLFAKGGAPGGFITALAEDSFGRLWVGSSLGLSRAASPGGANFALLPELSGVFISSLACAPDGVVWAGTAGKGIWRIQNGVAIQCAHTCGLKGNEDIRALLMGRDGVLWIGASGEGLISLKNNKIHAYTSENGLAGMDVRALFEDRDGALWIGTNGEGVSRLKSGVFSSFFHGDSLLGRPVRSFWQDAEGGLWVGTRDGLCLLRDGKFIIYNQRNGLPSDAVRAVFQGKDGSVWVGTVSGGLAKWQNGAWRTFGRAQGLKSEHIWTLDEGEDGSLWIGSYGGGLIHMENNRVIRTYDVRYGLSSNIVRAVLVARDKRIWAGVNGGGVDILEPSSGIITNINTRNGLADNFVYALAENSRGEIWAGCYNGAVNRIGPNGVITFSSSDGLPGQSIFCIYVDSADTVWLGSDGGGLLCFRDNRFFRFTMKDGLYDDLTFQITEDDRGFLWMNSNRGVYSARKQDLLDFAAGKRNRVPCGAFGKREGVKSTECSGPGQPAGIFSRDGRLWFPTVRGVVVLDPGNIPVNHVPPPVILEQLTADDRTVFLYPQKIQAPLRLSPGVRRLEFHYAGLSFISPRQMKFRFRLEGFDEDWRMTDSRRSAYYTNVPPGNYVFRVLAANSDGVWNEKGASLAIFIPPFFWQTLWFRFFMALLFALGSYWLIGFIRNHLRLTAFWRKKKFIGPYEIEEQIGAGGMGVIYRVHSVIEPSRVYALKVMKDELLPDKIQKRRFKNESLLVDRVEHPNSVRIFERGEDNDKLYLVMELLEGKTLAQRFREEQFPGIPEIVHIMFQVSDLLVALRQENIIHRDIKPENIILIEKGNDPSFVKLLDFGIARIQTLSNLTESGQVLGTLPFMPPEVLSDAELSPAVDIYSLGILGYLMITRREPFHGDSPMETMRQILNNHPSPPVFYNRETPPSLNSLIMRMIEKDPDLRPPALEVRAELSRLEELIRDIQA